MCAENCAVDAVLGFINASIGKQRFQRCSQQLDLFTLLNARDKLGEVIRQLLDRLQTGEIGELAKDAFRDVPAPAPPAPGPDATIGSSVGIIGANGSVLRVELA